VLLWMVSLVLSHALMTVDLTAKRPALNGGVILLLLAAEKVHQLRSCYQLVGVPFDAIFVLNGSSIRAVAYHSWQQQEGSLNAWLHNYS
jgi:hypothetical protein